MYVGSRKKKLVKFRLKYYNLKINCLSLVFRLSQLSGPLSSARTEVRSDLEEGSRASSVTGCTKEEEEEKSTKSRKILWNDSDSDRMSYTNRFPSSQHTRYRSSWGPSSVSVFNRVDVPRPSPEEEEYADFYHERLHSAQSRQLIPLQEDLADWINKTISECTTFLFIFQLIIRRFQITRNHARIFYST